MQPLDHIPTSAADITPTWLTAVLQRAGHDVDVSGVDIEPIGTGQMATSLRVTPTYGSPTDAPTSTVVKIASTDPNSRDAGARGAYLKEVRFYQQLAASLPTATPRCYWAVIDVERNDFALVLEDMRPGRQGDQIVGCDVESMVLAARNIAGLHAPHWGDPSLYEIDWLTAPPERQEAGRAEAKLVLSMLTPGFIDRYAGRLTADQVELLRWFAATVDEWLANDGGRFGLVHGDHRLDNLLFSPHDPARPVTVVDWQTLGVRNPVADISYLVGTSVEPDVRRSVERDVVAAYHEALVSLGVDDYDLDTCFDDYRNQTPHALLLCIIGSMSTIQTPRGDDMFMAMLRRSSAQILDHYPR